MDDLADLLVQASHAHGAYEATVLHGVYDTNWPSWYARWALDHGFNDLVVCPVATPTLAFLLRTAHEEQQATAKREAWAAFTAARLTDLLGLRPRPRRLRNAEPHARS